MGDALEKRVFFRNLLGKTSAFSHTKWEIVLKLAKVHILEMEDVLFHSNSAVMMPENPKGKSSKKDKDSSDSDVRKGQEKMTGVKTLALVFKQFEFNKNKRIVIAGHTDTTGSAEYNFELSEFRAENVLYLLTGEQKKWAEVCYNRHKVEDYQQILAYIYERQKHKWMCNPGNIDNAWGSKTRNATQNFILKYNSEYCAKHGHDPISEPAPLIKEIEKDSKKRWPKELWEAVYHFYIDDVCSILKVKPDEYKNLSDSTLKFVDDHKKYVGCGESFPIDKTEKDNYRSQSNRRVVIVLFDEDEKPVLNCPTDPPDPKARKEVHKEKDCPLWHGYHFMPLYIDPDDLYAVVYHVSFKYYNRIKKKLDDVPDGLAIQAFEKLKGKAKPEEIPTEQTYKNGVYSIKVKFKTDLNDPNREKIHFEFKTHDKTDPNSKEKWVYTDSKDAAPTIKEEKLADVKNFDLPKRLKYYDLPVHWSSQNYWTRYDGDMTKGERFEEVLKNKKKLKPFGGNVTAPDKQLIFSLDDIVLLDTNGKQNIKDKEFTVTWVAAGGTDKYGNPNQRANLAEAPTALKPESRFSLFYVNDKDKDVNVYKNRAARVRKIKAGNLILHDPESPGVAPYFTKTDSGFSSNLITNTPEDGQTRLIIFANDFYSVSDKRADAWVDPTDPFDPAKHVLGCRAAWIEGKDTDWHIGERFNYSTGVPAGHNKLYFADATGHFELHYIHDGCVISGPDDLKRRSFLLIYWSGHFVSYPAPPAPPPAHTDYSVSAAKLKDYATKGLSEAKERWEDKGYTIEPLKLIKDGGACDIQIKPVFYFEGKQQKDSTGKLIGGQPKCVVRITNDENDGEMGIYSSMMYWKDHTIRPCDAAGNEMPAGVPPYNRDHYGEPGTDRIDNKTYKALVVAHELSHAMGKDDEYEYSDRFNQYYPGMPYQIDHESMMYVNRSTRMKQIWFHVNWINNAAKPAVLAAPVKPKGKLNDFLNGAQFKIMYRFTGVGGGLPSKLNYHLAETPNDYRDIHKPAKSAIQTSPATGLATGTGGKVDTALYKLGRDELSWGIKIKNKYMSFPFDGILVVYLKLGFKFYPPTAGTTEYAKYIDTSVHPHKWKNTALTVMNDWLSGIRKPIKGLNNRFYLQKSSGNHDFKNTYIFFFPVCKVLKAGESPHYEIRVTLNDSSKIKKANGGKRLEIGNEVAKTWVANYILGIDNGAFKARLRRLFGTDKPDKDNVKFIEAWFKSQVANGNTFVLKGK